MRKEIILTAVHTNYVCENGLALTTEIEIAVGKAYKAMSRMEFLFMKRNPSTSDVFNTKLQRMLAETTEEEATRSALHAVKDASSKILWLNTVVKNITGENFVDYKIDKTNPNECLRLISDFYSTYDVEVLKRIAL